MAHRVLQRGAWPTRLGAVLVVAVALAACADDEPSAAPSDASPTSEETAAATSDEVDASESDASTSEEASEPEDTSGSTVESSDQSDDQSTSEQDQTDDGATITTTPPATDGDSEESSAGDGGSAGVEDAIHLTVPAIPVEVAAPVDIDQPADFGDGVQIRILEMESAEVTSELPGETGGPSVIVDLQFDNGSTKAIDLGNVTVDLVYGNEQSAIQVTTAPAELLTGPLAPGAKRTGRYVFSVPPDKRSEIELRVRYAADAPLVVLHGKGPTA